MEHQWSIATTVYYKFQVLRRTARVTLFIYSSIFDDCHRTRAEGMERIY